MCSIVPGPPVSLLEPQRCLMKPNMNDHRPADVLCQDWGRIAVESKPVEGQGK